MGNVLCSHYAERVTNRRLWRRSYRKSNGADGPFTQLTASSCRVGSSRTPGQERWISLLLRLLSSLSIDVLLNVEPSNCSCWRLTKLRKQTPIKLLASILGKIISHGIETRVRPGIVGSPLPPARPQSLRIPPSTSFLAIFLCPERLYSTQHPHLDPIVSQPLPYSAMYSRHRLQLRPQVG